MIKLYGEGDKLTPNQLAKWLIYDKTELAFYFDSDEHGGLTDKERDQVVNCLEKQQNRVFKLLGIDKLPC